MLRIIYALHLLFYGLFAFVMGLLLLPLGYVAVLVARGRLIHREWGLKISRDSFMLRAYDPLDKTRFEKSFKLFISFFLTGGF